MAKSRIETVICDKCNISFQKRISLIKPTRYNYCSNVCRKADPKANTTKWTEERRAAYSIKNSGENNPNYGKKWGDDKRKEASIKRIQQFEDNPDYRYSVGKSNRGKKFDQELIDKMHSGRSPESYGHQGNLSEEARKIIGESSISRFQDADFKEKYREIMELNGNWIPLEQKTEFELYYKESDWLNNMFDSMSEEDLKRIKEIGIFNAKENKNGLVRDHIISRVTGFKCKIPAILMRHPANMQIIPHAINARKGHLDKKLNEDQNEELILDLIKKIQNYDKQWIEEEKCNDCIRVFRFAPRAS